MQQTDVAEAEAAEAIASVGIHAGVVEHQVGLHLLDQIRQHGPDRRQIGLVLQAIGEGQVEVAGLLAQREVRGGVGREGEHARIAREDRCGAVALVHVEVHHQQLAHQSFGEQHPGGDGHVVEDAEAAAVVGEGVVGAAGQVAGQAVLQRQAGREHGAAHRQPAAPHQGRGGRQADAAFRRRAQCTTGKGLVV